MRWSLVSVCLAAACGGGAGAPVSPDAGPTPDATPEGCNPVVGDDCLTPFPSSFQTTPDPSSPTGVRLALRADRLPISRQKVALDVTRWNRRDGFSPAMPFFVYFKDGVDMTGLPDQSNAGLEASVAPTSPVQVIDAATGERVPLFVELDANAQPWDHQALIIRPMVRLRPSARYLIALVGLKDKAGRPLAPAPFRALRDGGPLDDATAPLRELYDDIFARLAGYGVPRASLSLAWDVQIGSEEQSTARLLAMRDEALAMADGGALAYTITSAADTPDRPDGLREVLATVQVPSYLESDDPIARLDLDAEGNPVVRAVVDVPIVIEIPRCAETAGKPLPFVVFGHGLFLDAQSTLGSPGMLWMANTLCMAFIGTDWLGLASQDIASLTELASDFNNYMFITDHLTQAHVNALVMTHLFAGQIAGDPALQMGGAPLVDAGERYYFGISNGGIQGGTFMAISPDLTRAVLNVAGGEWNLMMFRSTDFKLILPLLSLVYLDALDRQILVALTQLEWDYTDPMSFARHLVADPLPGAFAKRIILQESIGDSQVPNLASRLLARTIGLDALPLVQPVTGIAEKPGPLPSAYTQWDTHLTPLPPTTNTPAEQDNGSHEGILGHDQVMEQLRRFYRPDGQAEDTCGGPCSL